MFEIKRRGLLGVLLLAACLVSSPVLASDDDSDGGNSGSGGDSENSGSGGGDRDDGDRDDDDRDDDDNGGSETQNSNSGGSSVNLGLRDQERAFKAVRKGKAVSLVTLKSHLSTNYPGKILSVDMRRKSGVYYYQIRLLTAGNRIRSVSLNALSLKQDQP
jgi:uncharacterized membrane protein YkoI